MSGMFGEIVSLGQANGPDIDLIVSGSELYSTYETPQGLPVVYDDALGLFCYARVVEGEFVSSGIALTAPPPTGIEPHASESDAVRARKIQQRTLHMERNAQPKPTKE